MGTYTGTAGNDEIRPGYISPGVVAQPFGTLPSDAGDKIYGSPYLDSDDDDVLVGGGGNDKLEGRGGTTPWRAATVTTS